MLSTHLELWYRTVLFIIVVPSEGGNYKLGYTHQTTDANLSLHKLNSWTFDEYLDCIEDMKTKNMN